MKFQKFLQSDNALRPHFLLLGHPVAHSLSPLMHNTASRHYGFQERYFAVDLTENEFSSLSPHFNKNAFRGTNITVPYKEVLVDYVDNLDDSARDIRAINTIYKRDQRLIGANTDLYGFLKPLEEYQDELDGSRAIVFGTGGASKAVVAGLIEIGAVEIILISRTPARITSFNGYNEVKIKGYIEWSAYADEASIIVNTTPLGMEPNVESSPVRDAEKKFLESKICYDIVMKPLKTKFLQQAEQAGGIPLGGLEMLIYQGSKSFELWTGKPFPIDRIRQKLYEYLEQ